MVLLGERFVALPFVGVASSGSLRQGQAEEGPKRSPARSPLGAGLPANKASSRSGLPVAEAGRAVATGKAECLRLPPHRMPVQPIAGRCGVARQDLAGLMERWSTQVVGSGLSFVASVVARRPETRGMARLLRLWRPTQPATPPDSGPAVGVSPGRKPAPKVRPLATSSLDHAELLKTYSSRRTPFEKIPHA